jgi:hypothetical protein
MSDSETDKEKLRFGRKHHSVIVDARNVKEGSGPGYAQNSVRFYDNKRNPDVNN